MNTPNSKNRLLIAGGGTGGHILAGVAVADAWNERLGNQAQILFVGARGGLEEKLVPKAGYCLKTLKVGSLNRVSLGRKLKTFVQLPLALFYSAYLLLKWKPDFVLGVGGYSSGPLVLMARLLCFLRLIQVKVAILEQNSIPGMTNRILSRFAHLIFTSFPHMEKAFPGSNLIQSGSPIRASMKRMPPATRDPFTVFIFGGSQGAKGVNSLVLSALPYLSDLKNKIRFVHQTGEADYERVLEGHRKNETQSRVEKFIYDMPSVYQESSLLICRTGSSTLAEVAAIGRAAILIPLPTASDNHQELNARVYSEANAALCLNQQKATGEDLAKAIRELLVNDGRLRKMEESVTQFYFPNAAQNIVQGLFNSGH